MSSACRLVCFPNSGNFLLLIFLNMFMSLEQDSSFIPVT